MPFQSLGAFVDALRKAGELHVVTTSVDPRLEVSEIADRVVKAGGPALLFSNVKGSSFPVLVNQFGTQRRMAMALDATNLEAVGRRVRELIALAPPTGSIVEKFFGALRLAPLANAIPKIVRSGSAQDVVMAEPDVCKLPVLTTWPLDAGPFITLPLVITKDPSSGRNNVGMYRMQVFNGSETAMHWQRHKHGRAHADAWGARVPVAVAIGTDPALTYAATAPLPPIIDEFAFAGLLRGKPVELVAAKSVDLMVPADAEFVLEGYVDNEDLRLEGPFGDHTGVYSLADRYPTFQDRVHNAPSQPDLCGDRRRQTADGRRVARKGDGTHLLTASPGDAARSRRHESSGRGRLPQPRDRLDSQVLSGSSQESHERAVGPRTHDDADSRADRRGCRRRRTGLRAKSRGSSSTTSLRNATS